MIRFLILLLALCPIFCNAQVTIKSSTARFYLELYDKYEILVVKDSMQTELIGNLRTEIKLKDKVIETYKSDSVTYKMLVETKDEEIRLSKKEVKKQKVQKVLSWVGGAIIIILIL